MSNKIIKFSLCVLGVFLVVMSCAPDDNTLPPIVIEDRTEQQAKDKDSLLAYLSTHYYNSSFFETPANQRYTDIVISSIDDTDSDFNPDLHTMLISAVETIPVQYLDVQYEYYVLKLNQGGGESPNFTDAVRVRYEGSSVADGDVFDSSSNPVDFLLQGDGFTTFGTIKAWQLVMPYFSAVASNDFSIVNGVVSYNNFGLGVMFVPSGLAYFSGANTGSSYDNLIFKFELLQFEEQDHDADGVPSYLEDRDNSLDVFDDDTDEDGLPNYIDADDDGDGVPTINEDIDGDGDPTNDIGINGIPKYLDPEETESNAV